VAKEVLEQSGLTEEFITSGRLGVAFGSIHGSPTVQRNIYRIFFGADDKIAVKEIGAVDYLKSMVHTTAVNITKMFGITGRSYPREPPARQVPSRLVTATNPSNSSCRTPCSAGGADEYDTTTVAVFDNLLACSTAFNAEPNKTPRPFDKDRDGLVVGEGRARSCWKNTNLPKRGANILGEVIGFACNNNGVI